MYFPGRNHAYVIETMLKMKKMILDLQAHAVRLEEKLDCNTEFSETAALRVQGSAEVNNASALLEVDHGQASLGCHGHRGGS